MRTRSLALVASLPLLIPVSTASPSPTNSLDTQTAPTDLASLPDSSLHSFYFPPAPPIKPRFARRKRQAVSDGLSAIGVGAAGTDAGTGAEATAVSGETTSAAAAAGTTSAAGEGAVTTTTQAQATTTQQQQTTQPAETTQQQQTQTEQTSQAGASAGPSSLLPPS